MPGLDRRITLERDEGSRDSETGQFVSDWQPVATVWARRGSLGSVDTIDPGGSLIVLESVGWLFRWTAELAALSVDRLRVRDDEDQLWNPSLLTESDVRRRYLTLQATRVAT